MKKNIPAFIVLFYFFIFANTSCKKDLDHELDSNVFDSSYTGPEPVYIISFQPVYSNVHQRNILRVFLAYNKHIVDSKVQLYKDNNYLISTYTDTTTMLTDYLILAGQTHSYKVSMNYKGHKIKFTEPKSFTMY